MASPTVAANAYASAARILETAGAGKGSEADGTSFGAVLKEALNGVLDTGRKSDAQTVAMASGKANVMDVVTAVAETDVAVSTLVSVRDKVIQAYEDVMKMAICIFAVRVPAPSLRAKRSNPCPENASGLLRNSSSSQ